MTQQATRHARRVYVGGLPPMANEAIVATFFSNALAAIGGVNAMAGESVAGAYTRPLFNSTPAVSDTKHTLNTS